MKWIYGIWEWKKDRAETYHLVLEHTDRVNHETCVAIVVNDAGVWRGYYSYDWDSRRADDDPIK